MQSGRVTPCRVGASVVAFDAAEMIHHQAGLRVTLHVQKARCQKRRGPTGVAHVQPIHRHLDIEARALPVVRIELEFAGAARYGADDVREAGAGDVEFHAGMRRVDRPALRFDGHDLRGANQCQQCGNLWNAVRQEGHVDDSMPSQERGACLHLRRCVASIAGREG